jgi:hypothetical protein
MRTRRALVLALALIAARPSAAQSIGHKILGTLGLDAGSQPETGLYVANQFLLYDSSQLFNRFGARVPVDFSVQATADAIGISGAYELPGLHTFVDAAIAVPFAHVVGHVDGPQGSIDRLGLADVYVQPIALGWRLRRAELRTGYAFYLPTRRFEPGGVGNVSRGSWSHELSLGGTAYFDRRRRFRASALASWEINEPKLGVDLTRGSTVQIQGGSGATLGRRIDLGLVGYALWQVTDDSGSDLPPALRGARDRAYGLGAESGVRIREARARLTVRYTHDLLAWSRPRGQLLLFNLTFAPVSGPDLDPDSRKRSE